MENKFGEDNIDRGDMRIGSFFAMKLELQLFQYTRFYAIWAFNELETLQEKAEETETLRSNAFAFQAGLELAIPFSGALLTFGVEGVYTYPFVYVSRDKLWSFYKSTYGNANGFRYWTGSPFGPDSIAGAIWAGYEKGSWSIKGDFLFLTQGERASLSIFDSLDYHPVLMDSYEATKLRTPTGVPSYTYQLRISGTWLPKNWITLSLHPSYRIVMNHNNIENNLRHGFEIALSAQFIPRNLRSFNLVWK